MTFKNAVIHWYVEHHQIPPSNISSDMILKDLRHANPDTIWDHPVVKVFRNIHPGIIKPCL